MYDAGTKSDLESFIRGAFRARIALTLSKKEREREREQKEKRNAWLITQDQYTRLRREKGMEGKNG